MSQNQETTLTLSGALNGTLRGDLSCNAQNAALARRDDGMLPGTPLPLPGSGLPRNFRWADRSLILFADWPDLKNVYDAGLLDVLPADATEQEKAAQPRKWVLNAEADGLLLPDIGGRFAREWRPEQSDDAGRAAGTRQGDAIRNITGQSNLCSGGGSDSTNVGGVVFSGNGCFSAESSIGAHDTTETATQNGGRYRYLNFDASQTVPTAEENRPLNDAQPVAIYMGRNAADIAPEPPVAPASGLTLIQRYATAGDFTWTVPDLYDGKRYLVYVRMKGAGAGGRSGGRSGGNYSGYGGGEGCLVEFDLTVTPGETHSLTVGRGGAGGVLTPESGYTKDILAVPGKAGGASVFGETTAPGAPDYRGGTKAYPQGKTEIITPGAPGGSSVVGSNYTGHVRGSHGGGQGGGAIDAPQSSTGYICDGVWGGGGVGGSCVHGTQPNLVRFTPGSRGGDGFIEIFTR